MKKYPPSTYFRPKQDPINFWEWLKKQFQEAPGLMMLIGFIVIVVVAETIGCIACDFDPAWWLGGD